LCLIFFFLFFFDTVMTTSWSAHYTFSGRGKANARTAQEQTHKASEEKTTAAKEPQR